MTQAKKGDFVKVHYTGKLEDGTIFDSSRGKDPLGFTLGEGKLIPAFEAAVVGMNPGDSTTTTIPAEQAYGPHREEAVIEVERQHLPEDIDPQVGQKLQMQQEGGQPIVVAVTAVTDKTVTLDANHDLAGKDLTFDIELVEIS